MCCVQRSALMPFDLLVDEHLLLFLLGEWFARGVVMKGKKKYGGKSPPWGMDVTDGIGETWAAIGELASERVSGDDEDTDVDHAFGGVRRGDGRCHDEQIGVVPVVPAHRP